MSSQTTTPSEPGPYSAPYRAILRYGPSLLAWEVLRRDPGYRLAYAEQRVNDLAGAAANDNFVNQWGLHFR